MSVKELQIEALRLSPAERETLATELFRSLDTQPLSEVDAAWVAEADRRFAELRAGQVQGIPGNRVFGEIRRELGWQN
ncbi:MAG: addiction module protein [Limisphaerales bacterium]